MADDNTFAEFVRRIRAGDDAAAAELVRRFEPMIRLEVHMGLRDARLRRLFDSEDVCQSVLASFLVRASAGQYDLDEPKQLTGLLVQMARNKLASQARRHHKQKRDVRRVAPDAKDDQFGAAAEPSPSRQVEFRELLQRFRQRLTEEERQLADWRADGRPWAEIVAQVGGTEKARSKQLARAVERVARQLGIQED
jgi:RNA polymerase sigma-70 factor (ECF subfamily)